MTQYYDIIGDIHGSGTLLARLLKKLGYRRRQGTWRHDEGRKVLFLGDLIDRNPEQQQVLATVRGMVDNGDARCIMGNHEFNAIAWAMRNPVDGSYLRKHTPKNTVQHRAFLNAFGEDDSPAHQEWVRWFQTLPLWLELDGLQLVHACWEPSSMAALRALGLHDDNSPSDALLLAAHQKESPAWQAVETLCKGIEMPLPADCAGFHDKDGNVRHEIRIKWWSGDHTTYRQAALLPEDALKCIPAAPLPADAPLSRVNTPTFVGHYWLDPHAEQRPVAKLVACLDYSAGAGGPLVCYRWNGERILSREHFISASPCSADVLW